MSGKDSESSDPLKEKHKPKTKTKDINTASSSNSFPASDKAFDDILIIVFLLTLALTFLFFFIQYLRKEDHSMSNKCLKTRRRHRFGRMRKNSGHKPWLDPLDAFTEDLNLSQCNRHECNEQEEDDDDEEEDSDILIRSKISREFVQKHLDPFDLSPVKVNAKGSNSTCDLGDLLGVTLAAACAILFIFILSNIEE